MAEDIEAYWQNLKEGKDCMTEIPKDRWDWRDYYGDPAKEANKTNVNQGGFIDGIAEFDPLFFGISPREAEQIGPSAATLADARVESD
ncbi:beta-ketoacyl synthase N-terminal-like domain-containing protein [Bacillus sp. 4A_MP3]